MLLPIYIIWREKFQNAILAYTFTNIILLIFYSLAQNPPKRCNSSSENFLFEFIEKIPTYELEKPAFPSPVIYWSQSF